MNIETIENGQWASGELELTHVLEIRFAHLQNSFVWIFTKDFLVLRASSTFDTQMKLKANYTLPDELWIAPKFPFLTEI